MNDAARAGDQNHLVLFYSGTARSFQTTLVGYLHETAQRLPVVLLSETLSPDVAAALSDSRLFPQLREIVPVCQFSGKPRGVLAMNRYACKTARAIIARFTPSVVVAPSDNDSLFELYLMRFARKAGAFCVSISCTLTHPDVRMLRRYVDRRNVHARTPAWWPMWLRLTVIKLRKYAAHALVYWLLPLLQKQPPFWGLTSYILFRGISGMRDAHLQIVMSEKDYQIYRGRGVPTAKLRYLPHPASRARRFFEQVVWKAPGAGTSRKRIALFLLPENIISFRGQSCAIIPAEDVLQRRFQLIQAAVEELPGWEISIKPHPIIKSVAALVERCAILGNRVQFADPQARLETCIQNADLVADMPLSGSTGLFSAGLQRPDIPKFAINCDDEFYGDYYRTFPGVEYIATVDQFRAALRLVHLGRHHRPDGGAPASAGSGESLFSFIVERHRQGLRAETIV